MSQTESFIVHWVIFAILLYLVIEVRNLRNLHKEDAKFDFVLDTDFVRIRVDDFWENAFEINFVEGWTAGRSFFVGGEVIQPEPNDDEDDKEPFFDRERQGVYIHPIRDWYETSRLGHCRVGQSKELHLLVPTNLAREILEDLRIDSNQVISIGVAKDKHKGDKVTFGIYSFEMEKL